MRRVLGGILVLVGVVGLLACAAVAAGVWPVVARLHEQGEQLAGQSEEMLTSIDGRLDRWDAHLGQVAARLDEIEGASQLSLDAPDLGELERKGLIDLSDRLLAVVDDAVSTAEAVQAGAEALGGAAGMMHRIAGGWGTDSGETDSRLDNLVTSIDQTVATLRSARTRLENLRESLDQRQIAKTIQSVAQSLQAVLATLRGRISEADEYVGEARRQVADARQWLAWGARYGPPLVTAIAVWMALGQICLMVRGGRFLSRSVR